jgi:hypothetical protein
LSGCDETYRLPAATKDPDESLPVTLNFYADCVNAWRRNEPYSAGEFVRPFAKPNGYAYECTTAGVSGAREPVWPTVLARTVVDGSIVWTCVAAGSNGINPISEPTATSDAGLTVTDIIVVEAFKILATYAGGTDQEDYEVAYSFTLNGVTRIARQIVQVRKR